MKNPLKSIFLFILIYFHSFSFIFIYFHLNAVIVLLFFFKISCRECEMSKFYIAKVYSGHASADIANFKFFLFFFRFALSFIYFYNFFTRNYPSFNTFK